MKPSIPSSLSSFAKRHGLDGKTLLKVMKASLPPTVAVAMYGKFAALTATALILRSDISQTPSQILPPQ